MAILSKRHRRIPRTGRYANILMDETFKVVLCNPENEQLLKEIIELLIPGKRIDKLVLRDKEHHGFALSDKNVTFDLYCTDDNGEQFIVEMQHSKQHSYADRMLCYATYPIRTQLSEKVRAYRGSLMSRLLGRKPKGKMDYKLMPVYVVSIVNFSLEHEVAEALEEGGLVSRYEIRNAGSGELMTDALHFVYLELGRLDIGKDEPQRCRTLMEKFAWSLKYMHELEERPAGFAETVLGLLYSATEFANMSIGRQEQYYKIMTTQIDIIAQQEYARNEGREEGIAQRNIEIARQMLADGVAAGTICKYTGLSEEEIERL